MTLREFRDQRTKEKRKAVLEAAGESFQTNGYMRTSMEEVAKRARVSTATLYRYFASKEELFDAVARSTMDQLELAVGTTTDTENALAELTRAYARLLSDPATRRLFRMVVSECGRDARLAESFYSAVKSRLSDLFTAAIKRGAQAGLFAEIDMPEHVAGQLQGMIEHSTLMRGLVLGDDIDTLSEAEFIADDALATWKARWAR